MFFIKVFLIATIIGVVKSWDVAVTTTNKKVYFYNTNGSLLSKTNFESTEVSAISYDAARDLLLIIDELNVTDTIFSILSTTDNKTLPLVRKESILSLAFDAVSSTLFWISKSASGMTSAIKKMVLTEPRSNGYGAVVIGRPEGSGEYTGVAVDSCGGYIFWSEFALSNSTIKRARLNGSEVTVIVEKDLYTPNGLIVDHSQRRLYWTDDSEGTNFKIETSSIDGSDRRVVVKGTNQQPMHIAVGESYVYWTDEQRSCVWRALKTGTDQTKPIQFVQKFSNDGIPKGLAVNYISDEFIKTRYHCEALSKLSNGNSIQALIQTNLEKRNNQCVHGAAYNNSRCDCIDGYEGTKCEIRSCSVCLANPINCEASDVNRCVPVTHTQQPRSNETPHEAIPPNNITNPEPTPVAPAKGTNSEATPSIQSESDVVKHNENSLDQLVMAECTRTAVKDYAIIALAGLAGVLCLVIAVLVMEIIKLKKRPRIKKRFIVNKNVTPLTARPDQCEITIENCCNMNICETPCFEPRSTIRPNMIGGKTSKEEKQNLIDFMAEDC